jgi:rubrerythrin
MTQETHSDAAPANPRRGFLRAAGGLTLSASAVALLGGCETMARGKGKGGGNAAGDVKVLNYALGLEHEAVEIYQIAAETGLLKGRTLATAVQFQGHHKGHRDALAATVSKLGGTPAQAQGRAAAMAKLKGERLRTRADILDLAFRMEKIAATEYLKAIPAFSDKALGQVAARIVADETMHLTAYAMLLGRPLPKAALTFGA